ncbi:hypothetical protein Vafri_19477, partial [Volvox africanus]
TKEFTIDKTCLVLRHCNGFKKYAAVDFVIANGSECGQPSTYPSKPARTISSCDGNNTQREELALGITTGTTQTITDKAAKPSVSAHVLDAQHNKAADNNPNGTRASAVVCSSEESSKTRQSPLDQGLSDSKLVHSDLFGAPKAPIAVSAMPGSPVTDKCPGIPPPREGALFANPSPPSIIHSILGAMSPGEFKAELGELLYIGQGATGLVYRTSVTQLWDACMDSPRPAPVSVAVKFMICNTPQQLWQRAKEALLSKLVSHPNLVRTLAMDVTLVTPNTYREWGSMHRATLNAASVSLATNPKRPDSSAGFLLSGHPSHPSHPRWAVGEHQALQTVSTSQIPCLGPHESGSNNGPLAVAEEPRPQTHPPPKRRCAEHQGTRLRNRTLGSMMTAAKGGFQGPIVANAGRPPGSLGSEAPCTVEPSELWPGCCGSTRSEGRSITASKATSWVQPGTGSSVHGSCREFNLNLPLYSAVIPAGVMPGGCKGIDGDGDGGGGGSSGSGCMLCAGGEGNPLAMVGQSEVFQRPGIIRSLVGVGVGKNLADDAAASEDAGGSGEGNTTGVVSGAATASAVAARILPNVGLHPSTPMCPLQSLTPIAKSAAAAATVASIYRSELAHKAVVPMEVDGVMDGAAAPPTAFNRTPPDAGPAVPSPAMFMGMQVPRGSGTSHDSSVFGPEAVGQCATACGASGVKCTRGRSGEGDGIVGGGGRSNGGGEGGGAKGRSQHAEPVSFQDILYHLEALPGRFLAKVIMVRLGLSH